MRNLLDCAGDRAANAGHVAVWIPAASGVQAALIEEAPDTYFRPPYVGVGGWVGVETSKVDDQTVRRIDPRGVPSGGPEESRIGLLGAGATCSCVP
jgi:hypothetical protein